MSSLLYILSEVAIVVATMDVIQEEVVVVVEIQVNKNAGVNTTTKPTIFLFVVQKSLINQFRHRW